MTLPGTKLIQLLVYDKLIPTTDHGIERPQARPSLQQPTRTTRRMQAGATSSAFALQVPLQCSTTGTDSGSLRHWPPAVPLTLATSSVLFCHSSWHCQCATASVLQVELFTVELLVLILLLSGSFHWQPARSTAGSTVPYTVNLPVKSRSLAGSNYYESLTGS